MSTPSRPPATEYADALRAYHLAAANWLGLDPTQVLTLSLEGADDPRVSTVATWEAISKQEPPVGQALHPGLRNDGDNLTYTAGVVLDYDDSAALRNAIGPKPTPPWADREEWAP